MFSVSGELYHPRKCSITNRVISSKDHASISINIGKVDADGVYTGETVAVNVVGFLRSQSESDAALTQSVHTISSLSLTNFPSQIRSRAWSHPGSDQIHSRVEDCSREEEVNGLVSA